MEGNLEWKFRTEGGIWSSPSLHRELVIFGCFDCHMYTLNKDTGKVAWIFESSVKNQNPWEYVIKRPKRKKEVKFHEREESKREYRSGEMQMSVSSEYLTDTEYRLKTEYQSSGGYK